MALRRLLVDFSDAALNGKVFALSETRPEVNEVVLLRDSDGNICLGTVRAVRGPSVEVEPAWKTLSEARQPVTETPQNFSVASSWPYEFRISIFNPNDNVTTPTVENVIITPYPVAV